MTGSLPQSGERLPETLVGPFDAAAIARYAKASGDDNPLHIDNALAVAAGFAASPVHGMALMAAIEPALAAWRPDLALMRLNGAFVEPLLANEQAKLTGRVLRVNAAAPFEVLLRVAIQGPRRGPCVLAEAVLAPIPPDEAER